MKKININRKEFLLRLAGTGAACTQITVLTSGCSSLGRRGEVTVSGSGFVLNGKVHPIYSGSFHYWRHDPSLWPELFRQLSRLGLNTVCADVPWEVHEISKGRLDFGDQDKRKNLKNFIDLAEKRNFRVLLRLGPQTGGQLPHSGIPPRVLFDTEIAARTSTGTMEVQHAVGGQFPRPSYCCEKLYRELAVYFDTLIPIITEHLYPRGGPVIGIQLSNETSDYSSPGRLYGVDYHPQAMELYRGWLREKYSGELDRLNRYYGAQYQSFELVEPPRRFSGESYINLPPYMEWAEFREWSAIWSLSRLSRMVFERGLTGIPVFHSLSMDYRPSFSIPDAERTQGIDLEGIGGYPGRDDYNLERRLSRTLAGLSVYPFRPEFGGGRQLSDHYHYCTGDDLEFTALATLMHGVKGINFHMAVERDRWLCSPISRDGSVRKEYFDRYRKILRFLREVRFHEFEKQVEVIFLFNHGLERLFNLMQQGKSGAMSIPEEVFAEKVDLNFRSSLEACKTWTEQTVELILDVGFDWNYGSTRLSGEQLSRYRVAVLPAGDYLYREELTALRSFIQGGGILIFGPGRPRLNQWMQVDKGLDTFFSRASAAERAPENIMQDSSSAPGGGSAPGVLIHMQSPLEVNRLLKSFEVAQPFTRSNKNLDLSVFQRGGQRLLFVANSTDKPQKSDIFFRGSQKFRDSLNELNFSGKGKITVELDPYRIGVWEVS
ncbi:beta-galactosidase [Gemmatimonadota bacterium]